ncbi:hypothetical protein N2152v2_010722 [Parachlorella kessleri]
MQHHHPIVTRTIEPNVTIFSSSEVRVVLLPVGEAPEEIFQRYASLIVRHRQVEHNNVRSFYKEAQKSPFKFFPWKTGNMHFKFLPEDVALQPSPLSSLHNHRRVLGVVGIMHCPHVKDITKAYLQFEQRCKAFPDAFTLRCFAFAPSDEQIAEDRKKQPNFIMFPPGDWEQLDNHCEVVMHDFAACLLGELERWMLNASPAMVDLNTYADSPDFTGATTLEAVQNRLYTDEEIKTKKRYGRLQKAMGDYCLLAGSPLDAQDHYSTAADLARLSADWIWLGAALGGYAAAKVVESAISNGAFAINKSSVFNDEGQWRTPSRKKLDPDAQDSLSETSRSSSAFGGAQFWGVLRASGVEVELRALLGECKGATRRKGGLPLLIEADLKLARFLAGLHGPHARREVSELVSGLQSAAEGLGLPMDRLQTFVEGAQVLGLVGSARKRTLMIWQAVELSKMLGFPDASTLEVARKALEPPDDPSDADSEEDLWNRRRPLAAAGAAVPRSWGAVRAGCLEAVLGLAIYAKAHADVWDCAAALLREHPADLSSHRQQSLLENLLAAASQMAPADRSRPGPGPPPLLYFGDPRPLAPPQRPLRFVVAAIADPGAGGPNSQTPFLYDPFSARRQAAAAAAQHAQEQAPAGGGEAGAGGAGGAGGYQVSAEWVCGELASVDIEVHNPSLVGIRIDKLVLEAEYVGDPSMAPREYMTLTSTAQPAWKPKPVSLNIPASTRPVRIQLEGTPLLRGMLVLTGCRPEAPDWDGGGGRTEGGAEGPSLKLLLVRSSYPGGSSMKEGAKPPPYMPEPPVWVGAGGARRGRPKAAPCTLLLPRREQHERGGEAPPFRPEAPDWDGGGGRLKEGAEGPSLKLLLVRCSYPDESSMALLPRLTAFGGVTWFQPWSRKPINVARALALAARSASGRAADGAPGGAPGGTGGELGRYASGWVDRTALPEARVTVAPALPLATLTLAARAPQFSSQDYGSLGLVTSLPRSQQQQLALPSSGPGAAAATGAGGATLSAAGPGLHLLQGQVCRLELTVTNTGRLPVEEASVSVAPPPGKTPSRVTVTVDNEALARALPLDPGESATLTATFAAGLRSGGGGGGGSAAGESSTEELRLEYLGPLPPGSGTGGAGSTDVNGTGSAGDSGTGVTPGSATGAPGEEGEGGAGAVQLAAEAAAAERGAGAGTGRPQRLGRRAVLQLEVHVQPSVQVSQVQFREIYLPAAEGTAAADLVPAAAKGVGVNGGIAAASSNGGVPMPKGAAEGAAAAGAGAGWVRRCVMEVGVVNRGHWPLQVWAAEALPRPEDLLSAGYQDRLAPPSDPAAGLPGSALLAPGRRGTLSYILAPPQLPSQDSHQQQQQQPSPLPLVGAAGKRGLREPTYEEAQRGACAERLARGVGLFFRVDAEEEEGGGRAAGEDATAGVGVAPLVHGEVYNGLTYAALALLQPPGLTIQLTAFPLPAAQAGGGSWGSGASQQQQEDGDQDRLARQQEQEQQGWQWVSPPRDSPGPDAAQQPQQQWEGGGGQRQRSLQLQQQQHQQQQEPGPYQHFPGIVCAAGQPLQLSLQLCNNNRSSSYSSNSGAGGFDSSSGSGAGAGGGSSSAGGALEVEASFACRPVTGGTGAEAGGGGGEPAGAPPADGRELTAVWTGQVAGKWWPPSLVLGVQLAVSPGGIAAHQAGVCLLAPGLYQLSLQQVLCRPAAGQQQQPALNTLVQVQPCYVLVTAGGEETQQ